MLANYEFEGKTKEEAVKKACEELHVSEDQLEIEVLSYGSTGIFGLVGAKKAQIRVNLREALEAKIALVKKDADDFAFWRRFISIVVSIGAGLLLAIRSLDINVFELIGGG